jgi:UDP-N-acetyl-D-glucosamine dehydrogenase
MKFTPGPGLGGHCIPIDPFYLTWKAREFNFTTEFIELAGKTNENMPYYCRGKIWRALNAHSKAVRGSKILVLGVAYKKDISDMRESPALKVIELLLGQGGLVSYHDPYVAELPEFSLSSVPLEPEEYDLVAILTDHSDIDYEDVVTRSQLVVDFRNATKAVAPREGKVWKL